MDLEARVRVLEAAIKNLVIEGTVPSLLAIGAEVTPRNNIFNTIQYNDLGTLWIVNKVGEVILIVDNTFAIGTELNIDFTDLRDVPADYVNAGGQLIIVKDDESGLEYIPRLPISITSPVDTDPIAWNDTDGEFQNRSPSLLDFSLIPEYADNAAAVTGGLAVGKLYRTVDAVKIVH